MPALPGQPLAHTTVRVSAGIYDAPTPATLFHRVFADSGAQTITADSYFDPQILTQAGQTLSAYNAPPVLTVSHALVVAMSPSFRNPRSLQAAGTVEQELHPGYSVSAGFLHNSTWRLERRLDLNLFAPATSSAGLPIFPTTRPNPTIGRPADRGVGCTLGLQRAAADLQQPDRAPIQPQPELHPLADA